VLSGRHMHNIRTSSFANSTGCVDYTEDVLKREEGRERGGRKKERGERVDGGGERRETGSK
jgi:hypothetical protein